MAKRIDYQNPDDNLDEITDARNAEIRAWGKKVLADADAILLDEYPWSDWEQLVEDSTPPKTPKPRTPKPETTS